MRKPKLTSAVADGLATVASLAREDMAADERRDWGNAQKGLEYIRKLMATRKAGEGMPEVTHYKVWVHIEGLNKHGDCVQGDDWYEPQEAGCVRTAEEARELQGWLMDAADVAFRPRIKPYRGGA